MYFLIPDQQNNRVQASIFKEIGAVLTQGKVITFCVLAGLMVGPLEGFADVWGVPFLKATYGLDERVASSLPSLIFLGMCLGGPVLSYFAELKQRYAEVILIAGVVMLAGFILLLTGILPVAFLSILFVIIGVCCSYQILAIYQVSTFVASHQTGLTTALANMIIMMFGYFFHSVIGKVVDLTNVKEISDSNPLLQFQAKGLFYGISVIPFALTFSILGLSMFMVFYKRSDRRHKKI
jgi:hypothetical protein